MSTASISRRRNNSLTYLVAVALVALIAFAYQALKSQPSAQQTNAAVNALTQLPAVTVAEPDAARTQYKRETYQPHGWIDADGDGCNTRREVLIQEATAKPQINPDGCKLSHGHWRDRFTGYESNSDQDFQIDHLVALADTDRSGGWRWSQDKKIAFANNLDNPDELNAISNADNQQKSDKAPDEWLPKDKTARCDYIRAYVTIKSQWQLTVSQDQWNAIAKNWPACIS